MSTPAQGVLPQHQSLVYMPFPFTQRIRNALSCDGELLVFELSGTMFSSWATSFAHCVHIKEHRANLTLFTALIQHCINIQAPFVLETVVDEVEFWKINKGQLSHRIQPQSYRIWIPLTTHGALAFCQDCAITYPDHNMETPAKKKQRHNTFKEEEVGTHIRTKSQLMSALRLYFGARKPITDILFNTVDDINMEGNNTFERGDMHILSLLSADVYFKDKHIVEKHAQQRLHVAQSNLSRYLQSGPDETFNEALLSFMPDSILTECGLCRLITPGVGCILQTANDIFKYLLPHYIPPRRLVLNKIRTVLDSIGETLDAKYNNASLETILQISAAQLSSDQQPIFADPITYSPIEVFKNDAVLHQDSIGFQSSEDVQLQEVYPICTHLKHTNLDRITGAAMVSPEEVRRVYTQIVHETNTLLTSQITGVPSVYHEMMSDTSTTLSAFTELKQSPTTANPILLMTCKMFYQKTAQKDQNGYTGLGTRLIRTMVGASNCLRLMEQQVSLFLLLYCRHFTTTSNQVGIGGGFFIVCGPPDTGKSRACEQWLKCCSPPLCQESDGNSKKSYTANTTSQDLRCVYQDELKDLLIGGNDYSDAGSSSSIKTQQTLLSRGFVRYTRLTQNPHTGRYENDDILVMSRNMLVGNTNALNAIPPAIQSRASIIPVIRDIRQDATTTSVNTLVASRENQGVQMLEKSFMKCMQLISGLQGRFHAMDAFGGIPTGINDNMYVLFQLMFEKNHGTNTIAPRRCLDIKETAQGIMVMDLITLWYSRGFGAKYNFCQITEAKFFAARAVLRMEHIVAAMWMLTSSTSLRGHLLTVSQVLKGMIRWEGDFPVMSEDGDFLVLNTSQRSIFTDISHQLSNLGPGLVRQVLSEIQRGITNGLPNMKSDLNTMNQERLLINKAFIAEVLMPVENAILSILHQSIQSNTQVSLSYDEKYYVFDSAVRKSIYNVRESNTTLHQHLRVYTTSQINRALAMLSRREIIVNRAPGYAGDKINVWEPVQSHPICEYVPEGITGCEPVLTKPGVYKICKTCISPLIVHRSLLDNRGVSALGTHEKTCLDALLLGGGYKPMSRVVLGPAPMNDTHSIDHYVTIPPVPEASITIKNPFYSAQGNIGMNLLFDEPNLEDDPTNAFNGTIIPDDCMFPRSHPTVTFTHESMLEDKLVKARYQSLYNDACPKEFLPSHTNYI